VKKGGVTRNIEPEGIESRPPMRGSFPRSYVRKISAVRLRKGRGTKRNTLPIIRMLKSWRAKTALHRVITLGNLGGGQEGHGPPGTKYYFKVRMGRATKKQGQEGTSFSPAGQKN